MFIIHVMLIKKKTEIQQTSKSLHALRTTKQTFHLAFFFFFYFESKKWVQANTSLIAAY